MVTLTIMHIHKVDYTTVKLCGFLLLPDELRQPTSVPLRPDEKPFIGI